MALAWAYSIGSVLIVSLISLIGVIGLSIRAEKLKYLLLFFVSFSGGALLGDAFMHLLPEAAEAGFNFTMSLYILGGIIVFFVVV